MYFKYSHQLEQWAKFKKCISTLFEMFLFLKYLAFQFQWETLFHNHLNKQTNFVMGFAFGHKSKTHHVSYFCIVTAAVKRHHKSIFTLKKTKGTRTRNMGE